MLLPRPRAYVDWVVPLDDQGREIGVCHDPESYRRYLEWLADYLYFTDISIPENQKPLLAEFEAKGGIESAVFWTSDELGMSCWDVSLIEEEYLSGASYGEFHANQLKTWDELPEDWRQEIEEASEDFFISEADYDRIGLEALEARKVPSHIKHSDIPYRPVFAKLLKSVESRDERIAHLDYFYSNFYDVISG